jgi:hypothetical protein
MAANCHVAEDVGMRQIVPRARPCDIGSPACALTAGAIVRPYCESEDGDLGPGRQLKKPRIGSRAQLELVLFGIDVVVGRQAQRSDRGGAPMPKATVNGVSL